VVAALNELEAGGYVERTPDPDDGRRNIITITAAGRRRHKRLTTLVTRAQEEIFAPLSPADRDRLAKLLGRLLAHHQAE
jgi:DNA-binding MarR family transcriptional regulator